MEEFQFLEIEICDLLKGRKKLIGVMPNVISTKDELLKAMSVALKFPPEFSRNWEGLASALNDFVWVRRREIILLHNSLPHLNDIELHIYFSILAEAVMGWREKEKHNFTVIFPGFLRNLVRSIMHTEYEDMEAEAGISV